jgi:alpha-N-acetylglucosaminidase
VRGFIEAVPKGKFVIIDMTLDGAGEFAQWNSPDDYWGAPFILTAIHDMGGNDGMKGNLSTINAMPFAQQAAAEMAAGGGHGANEILGTGLTPEGIDQVSRRLSSVCTCHCQLICYLLAP